MIPYPRKGQRREILNRDDSLAKLTILGCYKQTSPISKEGWVGLLGLGGWNQIIRLFSFLPFKFLGFI